MNTQQQSVSVVDSLIQAIDFLDQKLDEPDCKTNDASIEESKGKVVIFGSGLIGCNWAVLFARARYTVVLFDIKDEQLQQALVSIINEKLPSMNLNDMLYGQSPKVIEQRISCTMNLEEALTDAIFVQECVPESIGLKQKIFASIDDTLNNIKNGEQCIISSSTSTIVPSILIKQMKNFKENLIVCHPVNPPMAVPVIEICPSPVTNASVVKRTREIMVDIGLKPCVMKKESIGFVLNRLQYGLLQAAFQLVEDGVASAEDVDMTVKYGLGLRWSFMGPFETIHLNAPKGVLDYGERYSKLCMAAVMKTIPNEMEFKKSTWQAVHDEMSERIPVHKIDDRRKWRNERLLKLAVHQRDMEKLGL